MNEITLEKTYDLLEKLAEYVMTEVPTRREMNERFGQVDERLRLIEYQLEQKADKKDLEEAKNSIHTILDAMTRRIDDMQIEQKAFIIGLQRLEDRVVVLEKKFDA